MAAFKLTEPIRRALVTRLTSDLPALIASINAELADGIDLEMPARILPIVPSIGILRDWPTIGIQGLPTQVRDDIGTSFVAECELAVIVFEQDADLEALGWRLVRWERAITTATMRDRELGVAGTDAYSVNHKRSIPGPTLGDSEDPEQVKTHVSWTSCLFRFEREE